MKNNTLFILTLLFGLMMVNAGLNKFLHYMPMPKPDEDTMAIFGAFSTLLWIMPLVAIIEIIGGILISIPRFRALGAIVIFPVMVGIVIHHLVLDQEGLAIPLVMVLINFWAIADNIDKYLPMIKEQLESTAD
ncbi:DoxX family protein [Membranihabitans maritimus]|uniref:DoxX family protein n=1 Tax=Membranihabitans maritimus TaxID=2904244 RepID=UPI001F298052|nr:DoxX family protein [Membranihabitans maritimus]